MLSISVTNKGWVLEGIRGPPGCFWRLGPLGVTLSCLIICLIVFLLQTGSRYLYIPYITITLLKSYANIQYLLIPANDQSKCQTSPTLSHCIFLDGRNRESHQKFTLGPNPRSKRRWIIIPPKSWVKSHANKRVIIPKQMWVKIPPKSWV